MHSDNEERDKCIRSANMQKKELSERKIRIVPAMDAEERVHQKRLGYTKFCMRKRRGIRLMMITLSRRKTRHS